jgi:hypothetical protein
MSVERDLLEQEWTGTQELFPGVYIDKHIRDLDAHGEEVRVTIEMGEDEDTVAVFYGTPEEAREWLREFEEEIDAAAMPHDLTEVVEGRREAGALDVGRLASLGWGDLEAGRIRLAAGRVPAPLPSVHEMARHLPKRTIVVGEHADGTQVTLEIGGTDASA